MAIPWKSARQFLRLVTLGICVALPVGCADAPRGHVDGADVVVCPQGRAIAIDQPAKIGIGAWAKGPPGWAAGRLAVLGVSWYYDWGPHPLASDGSEGRPEFIPMIWGVGQLRDDPTALPDIARSHATALLGFNEPDRPDQAAMTVGQAVAHWPALVASGKRLGSPAPSQPQALSPEGWLARFMDAVLTSRLRVDFVTVHYYSATPDIAPFRNFLERTHRTYGRPIWVTEWALVHPDTWHDNRARYSLDDAACFFRAGAAMLDDLDFVERHAWFAAFDGGDGWHLNTHAVAADGSLTQVGRAIAEAAGAISEVARPEALSW